MQTALFKTVRYFKISHNKFYMNNFPRRVLICVCLFILSGHVIADSLSDAQLAYFSGDYAKAEKLFRPLAEQGNSSAQRALGLMYGLGQGVEKDYVEAEKWSRLVVKQRHVLMQRNSDRI